MGGAAIAALVNMLRIMLFAKAGALVAKVLLFFGLAVGVNKFAINPMTDQIKAHISTGAPGEIGATLTAWAGVMQLDTALSMILSAYAAAWTIKTAKAFLTKAT